jgi:hypothetical protein
LPPQRSLFHSTLFGAKTRALKALNHIRSLHHLPAATIDSSYDMQMQETSLVQKANNLHKDNKGFGLANFLTWRVAGWDYDKPYTVKISNISVPGGGTRDIFYPVMVDRFNLLNLVHPLESTDSATGSTLAGSFNSAADKDSYKVAITGKKTISGQRGFFVLVYDINKRLVASSDSTISGEFGFGKHTVVVSLCNEERTCYSGTNSYRLNIN